MGERPGSAGNLPWIRHTIDDTSFGADGVRLGDANGDGRPDIATGWEEGGVVRVYLHPGPARVKEAWPRVTVGKVGSPEDAVFFDMDGDGALDVISCTEGKVKTIWVHWAPRDPRRYRDPTAWKTEPLPASFHKKWMFALPLQMDGKGGIDLLAGAKGRGAELGFFRSPADPRDLKQWRWEPLRPIGWTMSLLPADLDGDGDTDVVFSDRKGERSGCFWLENPGATGTWRIHPIGARNKETMFLTVSASRRTAPPDILAAVRPRELLYFHSPGGLNSPWNSTPIPLPPQAGMAKGVGIGDIDLDGSPDIVFSCENAKGRSGVMWLSGTRTSSGDSWVAHDISGPEGEKFDLIQLVDLDEDGDLDVLTCEERENLGVIWYENPARSRENRIETQERHEKGS